MSPNSRRIKEKFKEHVVRGFIRRSKMRVRTTCFWCDEQLTKKTATLDHIIPTSLGGKTDMDNCKLSCPSCNNSRGNIDADEFSISDWLLKKIKQILEEEKNRKDAASRNL